MKTLFFTVIASFEIFDKSKAKSVSTTALIDIFRPEKIETRPFPSSFHSFTNSGSKATFLTSFEVVFVTFSLACDSIFWMTNSVVSSFFKNPNLKCATVAPIPKSTIITAPQKIVALIFFISFPFFDRLSQHSPTEKVIMLLFHQTLILQIRKCGCL